MEIFDPSVPVSCIIFDCDGTLVDSEVLSQTALVKVFDEYGVKLDLKECMDNFQGGKITDILTQTCERHNLQIRLDELEPSYRAICERLFENYLVPVAGVPSLLAQLDELNIDMCVASNGPVAKMHHALELTDLLPYFEGKLFSAFETNSWKPAPDLLHFSALNMGWPISECLFVDDTVRGVQAGINAGIRTVYFSSYPGKELIEHPLVKTVSSMKELYSLVTSLPVTTG